MTKHAASTLEDALVVAIEALDKIKKCKSHPSVMDKILEANIETATKALLEIKYMLQEKVRQRHDNPHEPTA